MTEPKHVSAWLVAMYGEALGVALSDWRARYDPDGRLDWGEAVRLDAEARLDLEGLGGVAGKLRGLLAAMVEGGVWDWGEDADVEYAFALVSEYIRIFHRGAGFDPAARPIGFEDARPLWLAGEALAERYRRAWDVRLASDTESADDVLDVDPYRRPRLSEPCLRVVWIAKGAA